MAVDTEDILIFKARKMKAAGQKKPEEAAGVQAQAEEKPVEAGTIPAYEMPVESLPQAKKEKVISVTKNPFIKVAGAILVVNAIVLGYFIYPQAAALSAYASSAGIVSFIANFNFSYTTDIVNVALVLLNALAGIFSFTKWRGNFVLDAASSSLTLMLGVFEFFSDTYLTYFLAVVALALLSIGSIAYGRMSAVAIEEEKTKMPDINWPGAEKF